MASKPLDPHEHEYLSLCCGEPEHEYVEGMCSGCREWTGFECDCEVANALR